MTDYIKCDPYLVNVRYRHRYFDVGIIRPRPNWPRGAFTYDVRCFGGIFDLPTLIRYFTT